MAKLEEVRRLEAIEDEAVQIKKPAEKKSGSILDQFKSDHEDVGDVQPLLAALPHFRISEANDFVRLHPDEENYWESEMWFVNVPIKGQKKDTLHLVAKPLAKLYLTGKKILRFRLALASKPHDVFFLCHVPSRNLDNKYNETSERACQQAKTTWVQVTSKDGEEDYKITPARNQDFAPEPKWPSQSLDELLETTFSGRMITSEDDPAFLRLVGDKQSLR
jgi:hypothetical protein